MTRTFKVKNDIATAVSLPTLVGEDPAAGVPIEQEDIYLPGAPLPANLSPRIVEAFDNEDEHVLGLIEEVGGEESKDEPPPAQKRGGKKQASGKAKAADAPPESVDTPNTAGAPAGSPASDNPFENA